MIEIQRRIEEWNREAAALRQSIPATIRGLPAVRLTLAMQEEAAAIMEALTDRIALEGRRHAKTD